MRVLPAVKLVKAEDHSIAAGRDVTIIVNIGDSAAPAGEVMRLVAEKLHLDSLVGSPNRAALVTDQIAGSMGMVAQAGMIETSDVYRNHYRKEDTVRSAIEKAGMAFREQRFDAAHDLYASVMGEAPEGLVDQLAYDFLVTGYVAKAMTSDIGSLRNLLERCRDDEFPRRDPVFRLVLAEAHQEIATRQTSATMLVENGELLDELLASLGEEDIGLLNLRGLRLRRMGERNEISPADRLQSLVDADALFRRIHTLTSGEMGAEKRNNWAVALIRTAELTEETSYLDTAESILNEIDFEAKSFTLNDYLALPKALNNKGNIFKQRLRRNSDVRCYTEALEAYGEAERYWTERQTPYEWAMIQKNKADVRCEHLAVSGFDKRTAVKALKEIDASLKHRNAENAPYQYGRSLEVKRRVEKLLRDNA